MTEENLFYFDDYLSIFMFIDIFFLIFDGHIYIKSFPVEYI